MLKEIMLSQLLALIAVSADTKRIVGGGRLLFDSDRWENVDITKTSYNFNVDWKAKNGKNQSIYMSLTDIRKPYPHCSEKEEKYYQPIFHAYYFVGDNCNEYTRFIYEIIALNIDIIDDIGLVGNGGEYLRKNLLKINPHEIHKMKVRNEGRWSEAEQGDKC